MRRINYSRRAVETRRYTYNIVTMYIRSCGAVRGVSVENDFCFEPSRRGDNSVRAARRPRIYASERARVYSGGGRECWSRSGPGRLEGADAAQARYASAHHCHNDFITNTKARSAVTIGSAAAAAVELGAGVVRSCALERMDGGGGVFIIISIRSSPSPPVNARPFLSRSRGRLCRARTHTHTHTKRRVSHSFALNSGACAYILMRDDIFIL